MENQLELQNTQAPEISNSGLVANKDSFEHVQRVAKMFAGSDLVPKRYVGNIGNCVIALEMSSRMGVNPLMVMQHLNIIQGSPSWASKFLIASLNASGKFSPLRYEQDEKNGGRVRAWATDKSGEKCFGVWVSMDMAKAEGWIEKAGSKWKTMPELMIRYRAASFFVNQFAPEISMGFPTTEEMYDITPFTEVVDEGNGIDAKEELHRELDMRFDALKKRLSEPDKKIAEEIINTKEVKSYDKLSKLFDSYKLPEA